MRITINASLLTCPVTKELFKAPVALQCGHMTDSNALEIGKSCPVCAKIITSITKPIVALKSAIETSSKPYFSAAHNQLMVDVEVNIKDFRDTITQEYISEPVILSCGHINEGDSIKGAKAVCPMCNHKDITFTPVNLSLQTIINTACATSVNYLEDQYLSDELLTRRLTEPAVDHYLLVLIKAKKMQAAFAKEIRNLLKERNADELLELVNRALVVDPGNIKYLEIKTILLNLIEHYKESLEISDSLITSGNKSSKIRAERAFAKIMLKINDELADDMHATLINTYLPKGFEAFFKKLLARDPEAQKQELDISARLKEQYIVAKALYLLMNGSAAEASVLLDRPVPEKFAHEWRLVRAITHLSLNQAEPAMVDLEYVISISPDDYLARYYRGQIKLKKLDDAQGAIEDFQVAAKQSPGLVLIDLTEAKRQVGDLPGALEGLDALIAENPRNFQYRQARSMVLYRLKKLDIAQSDLDFIISEKPSDKNIYFSALLTKACYEYDCQRFNSALQYVNTFIEQVQSHASAYVLRAKIYEKNEVYDLALADLNRAFELKIEGEEKLEAYLLRSIVNLKKGNFEAAINDASSCLQLCEIDSSNSIVFQINCLLTRSDCYIKMGKLVESTAELDKLLALKNIPPQSYARISQILLRSSRYKYVTEFVSKVDPDYKNVDLIMAASIAHREQNQFEPALILAEKAIALAPNNVVSISLRASIYEESQQYQKAITDYTHALNLNQEQLGGSHLTYSFINYQGRSRAHLKLNQLNEALSDVDETLKIFPDEPTSQALKRAVVQAIAEQSKSTGLSTLSVFSLNKDKGPDQPPAEQSPSGQNIVPGM